MDVDGRFQIKPLEKDQLGVDAYISVKWVWSIWNGCRFVSELVLQQAIWRLSKIGSLIVMRVRCSWIVGGLCPVVGHQPEDVGLGDDANKGAVGINHRKSANFVV